MTIRKNSIVVRMDGDDWSETRFRVEDVDGRKVTMRSLDDYMLTLGSTDDLAVRYQVDTFERGDIVRVRREYADRYSEADGANELTVTDQKSGNVPTTVVVNNCGDQFGILNERLYLVRPGKGFKEGDRVVVDLDLAKKFDYDGISDYWGSVGVMTLTEDSGSRSVKYTSHVEFDDNDQTNNVPTRWLKLYEEPAKRVVGETIKAEDIKVGDKVKATDTVFGLLRELTGVVAEVSTTCGFTLLHTANRTAFPTESSGAVYTLLEEASEPVDENLQRLLDAEIGDIAHSTYAHEYWKKVDDDAWRLLELDTNMVRTTDHVFNMFYKLKYGTLEIYRMVEDAN